MEHRLSYNNHVLVDTTIDVSPEKRQQEIRCNLKADSNAGRLAVTRRDRIRHLLRNSPGRAVRMSGRLYRIS
jgi:hypothetical protein